MANFHRHPDNLIFVCGENVTYQDTLENFEADYGQALPSLPGGMIEDFYWPGVKHFFSDGQNAYPAPLTDAFGDQVIAALPALIEAQQARWVLLEEDLLGTPGDEL